MLHSAIVTLRLGVLVMVSSILLSACDVTVTLSSGSVSSRGNTTPPVLSFIHLTNGQIVPESLTVSGFVSDRAGVTNIKVMAKGTTAFVIVPAALTISGSVTAFEATVPLTETGDYAICAVAVNKNNLTYSNTVLVKANGQGGQGASSANASSQQASSSSVPSSATASSATPSSATASSVTPSSAAVSSASLSSATPSSSFSSSSAVSSSALSSSSAPSSAALSSEISSAASSIEASSSAVSSLLSSSAASSTTPSSAASSAAVSSSPLSSSAQASSIAASSVSPSSAPLSSAAASSLAASSLAASSVTPSSAAASSVSAATNIIVHFKKPAAWAGAYIHFWGAGLTSTTWGSNPAMNTEANGWYGYTITNSPANFLFKNTAGTNGVQQTPDQTVVSGPEVWLWSDTNLYRSNPEDANIPALVIQSPSSDYRTVGSESFNMSGLVACGGGVGSVSVSVNGGGYNNATLSGSTWSRSVTLNIGTNTVSVYATGSTGQSSTVTTLHIIRNNSTKPTHDGVTWSGKYGANLYTNGVEFSVHWRPSIVSSVAVKIGSTSYPMTHPNGITTNWWCFVPGAAALDEYQFVGNGTNTVADIYSKYNRYSSGKSVVVDQGLFTWTDQAWTRPGWDYYQIYELHVKDFTSADTTVPATHRGKYLGIVDKIPYLTNLGMTAIHVMPPSEFPDAGYSWGYNTSLFMSIESGYAVNPSQGQDGVDEFKAMVNSCHNAGIAVIVDLVFNHVGNNDNHFWSMDSLLYFDYNNNGAVEASPGGADATPWGNRLVTWRDEVKRYGRDTISYFMNDLHVDGFRFDATHNYYMDHGFVKAISAHARSIDSAVYLVYENLPNEDDLKTYGAQWSDPYHDDGVSVFRTDGSFDSKAFRWRVLGSYSWANGSGESLNYLESHDEDTLGYHANLKGFDPGTAKARSRACAVLLAGSRGVPMIWMGQEFLRAREGQNINELPLDWSLYTTYNDVFNYYAGVFRLRKNHPTLRQWDGVTWIYEPNASEPNMMAFKLAAVSGDKDFVVMVNMDRYNAKSFTLPAGTWIKVVTEGSVDQAGTASGTVSVGANSGCIFMAQ